MEFHCAECNERIDLHAPVGFCRKCGEPMCIRCAAHTMPFSKVLESLYNSPLGLFYTRRAINFDLTVCGNCELDYQREKRSAIVKSVGYGAVTSLVVSLTSVIILSIVGGQQIFEFALIVGILSGFLISIPINHHLIEKIETELSPCCPACGKSVVDELVQMDESTRTQQAIYGFHCTCGYTGPLTPIDGLFHFVDKYGPASLGGTGLENAAKFSQQVRSSQSKNP